MEELTASIFRIEEFAKQVTSKKSILLAAFLQIVGELLPDYTMSHPGGKKVPSINLPLNSGSSNLQLPDVTKFN
jgi:hypothetical protein